MSPNRPLTPTPPPPLHIRTCEVPRLTRRGDSWRSSTAHIDIQAEMQPAPSQDPKSKSEPPSERHRRGPGPIEEPQARPLSRLLQRVSASPSLSSTTHWEPPFSGVQPMQSLSSDGHRGVRWNPRASSSIRRQSRRSLAGWSSCWTVAVSPAPAGAGRRRGAGAALRDRTLMGLHARDRAGGAQARLGTQAAAALRSRDRVSGAAQDRRWTGGRAPPARSGERARRPPRSEGQARLLPIKAGGESDPRRNLVRAKEMARKSNRQVVELEREGGRTFALRFRAYGKRR